MDSHPLESTTDTLPSTDSAVSPRDLVGGLANGLLVIEAFDQDRPRLSIAEVAARTGLTRAAARRYLLTLLHLGFVQQDGRLFALSPKVLRLGQSYMRSARLPRVIQPQLQHLAMAMQEASSVGVLDGADVISVAAATVGRAVSTTLQPGTRVPAHCSANGRVLLAALPDAALDHWLAAHPLEARTPRTLVRTEDLRQELLRVRQQGYAMVDQELEVGLRTISVPLKNFRGDTVAAMNVSAHAARMRLEDLQERCLPVLMQAQAQLVQLL
jgi:IclR family transcriptional regulator, pca regulon regulatory protein